MSLMKKLFGDYSSRELKSIYPIVDKIDALADEYKAMSDAQLKAKTQEFKDRKVYDLTASHLRKAGRAGSQVTFSQEGAPQASGGESLLFTTRTCPNCRQAEALLQKAGVPYQKVVAEESPDLTTRYGVRQAPTLVVQGESITGLGPIKRFAEEHRAREVG